MNMNLIYYNSVYLKFPKGNEKFLKKKLLADKSSNVDCDFIGIVLEVWPWINVLANCAHI